MSATLGSLHNDQIHALRDSLLHMRQLATNDSHQHATTVTPVNHLLGDPQPGDEGLDVVLDADVNIEGEIADVVLGEGSQEVDPDWLAGERLGFLELGAETCWGERARTNCAEAGREREREREVGKFETGRSKKREKKKRRKEENESERGRRKKQG